MSGKRYGENDMSEFIRCKRCGATNYKINKKCRRCGCNSVQISKNSLNISFAFWLSGLVFYFPANIYPILSSSKFGHPTQSTIIGGMLNLWSSGDYPVAIIIFLASIMIPILKFLILIYLIISIKFKLYENRRDKIRLYHFIELSGPWSLIDVFVVIILTALIHFKNIAIIPGIGATSFAVMVFFTILSAMSLDQRVLGDIDANYR